MRHGKKVNHLSRKKGHRRNLLSNMACSLIEHKRINTTLAKAKALRVYVEPLLTKSKKDSTHSRRTVFSYLQDKEIVAELFREVAPKIATRNGGYTRIIRTGYRLGDNAEMCMIELVDFNEIYTKEAKTKTTRRSRRGGKKTSSAEHVVTEETTPEVTEAVVEDAVEVSATEATEAVVKDAVEVTAPETTEDEVEETSPEATKDVVEDEDAVDETSAETTSEEDSKEDDNAPEDDKKEA
tara:strand:+ start:2858 stop:3574 length:717 start_codon:yes stop_codon:yes gene_type:complete